MALTRPEIHHGPMSEDPTPRVKHKFIEIDNRVHEIHKVVVHRFKMGDVDDPDIYAAQPLWEWQDSEIGKWVMARAVDTPEWHRQADLMSYGYNYIIVAKLKDIDYTWWQLKWGLDTQVK
jgi:hypothetical protein